MKTRGKNTEVARLEARIAELEADRLERITLDIDRLIRNHHVKPASRGALIAAVGRLPVREAATLLETFGGAPFVNLDSEMTRLDEEGAAIDAEIEAQEAEAARELAEEEAEEE